MLTQVNAVIHKVERLLDNLVTEDEVMFCEKCGTFNDDDAVFCVNCGGKLDGRIEVGTSNKKNSTLLIIIIISVFIVAIAAVSIILVIRMKGNKAGSVETTYEIEDIEKDNYGMEQEVGDIEDDEIEEEYEIEKYEETVSPINMSRIVDVTATSVLKEKKRTHYADRAIDGDLTAAWTEAASGTGAGEAITFYFDDVYRVSGFYIHAGYHKTEKLYWENARPRILEISCGGVSYGEYSLRDFFGEQEIILSEPVDADQITLTIRDVYEGTKYEDAVISEIYFY